MGIVARNVQSGGTVHTGRRNKMRLIDADKFIRWIDCGYFRQPCEKCFGEYDVVRKIVEQPTAYDVDKVVDQLRKTMVYCSGYPNCNEYDYAYETAVNDMKKKAIEIVKKGGVE